MIKKIYFFMVLGVFLGTNGNATQNSSSTPQNFPMATNQKSEGMIGMECFCHPPKTAGVESSNPQPRTNPTPSSTTGVPESSSSSTTPQNVSKSFLIDISNSTSSSYMAFRSMDELKISADVQDSKGVIETIVILNQSLKTKTADNLWFFSLLGELNLPIETLNKKILKMNMMIGSYSGNIDLRDVSTLNNLQKISAKVSTPNTPGSPQSNEHELIIDGHAYGVSETK